MLANNVDGTLTDAPTLLWCSRHSVTMLAGKLLQLHIDTTEGTSQSCMMATMASSTSHQSLLVHALKYVLVVHFLGTVASETAIELRAFGSIRASQHMLGAHEGSDQ